jgi:hypothetical protein
MLQFLSWVGAPQLDRETAVVQPARKTRRWRGLDNSPIIRERQVNGVAGQELECRGVVIPWQVAAEPLSLTSSKGVVIKS